MDRGLYKRKNIAFDGAIDRRTRRSYQLSLHRKEAKDEKLFKLRKIDTINESSKLEKIDENKENPPKNIPDKKTEKTAHNRLLMLKKFKDEKELKKKLIQIQNKRPLFKLSTNLVYTPPKLLVGTRINGANGKKAEVKKTPVIPVRTVCTRSQTAHASNNFKGNVPCKSDTKLVQRFVSKQKNAVKKDKPLKSFAPEDFKFVPPVIEVSKPAPKKNFDQMFDDLVLNMSLTLGNYEASNDIENLNYNTVCTLSSEAESNENTKSNNNVVALEKTVPSDTNNTCETKEILRPKTPKRSSTNLEPIPNKIRHSSTGILLSASYFRDLLQTHIDKLKALCNTWGIIKEENVEVTVEGNEQILLAIGQAELIMSSKFQQFSELISECEKDKTELPVTVLDLQGFWDMMYCQVGKIMEKFENLEKLQKNNWKEEIVQPVNRQSKKNVTNKPNIYRKTESKIKSQMVLIRKQQKENLVANEEIANSPLGIKILSDGVIRRTSLRKSVLCKNFIQVITSPEIKISQDCNSSCGKMESESKDSVPFDDPFSPFKAANKVTRRSTRLTGHTSNLISFVDESQSAENLLESIMEENSSSATGFAKTPRRSNRLCNVTTQLT